MGAPTPKFVLFCNFFAENLMKMTEFGPRGDAHPWCPPLDPPILTGLELIRIYCGPRSLFSGQIFHHWPNNKKNTVPVAIIIDIQLVAIFL